MSSRARNRNMMVGTAVMVAAAALAAFGLSAATSSATGCGSLPTKVASTAVHHSLVIELTGNSEASQSDVAKFVQSELLDSSVSDESRPLAVDVQFVKYGSLLLPHGDCLRQTTILAPGSDDLTTYRDSGTSASTKKQLLSEFTALRAKQIGWVSTAMAQEVKETSFAGLDPKSPRLSPLLFWSALTTQALPGDSWVSALSPFTSTVNDCLSNVGKSRAEALGAVNDCIQFGQLKRVTVAHTSFVVSRSSRSLASSVISDNIRFALCRGATIDHCSGD